MLRNFFAFVSLWLIFCAALAAQTRRPNVIFILADDMGYGDLGSYGAPDTRTPHLDRLARQGVRLTHFYSNGPVCTPTRAAFVTGRYQQRVGLEWAIRSEDKESGLPASETSIARMLKGSGYTTALFGKWHVGYKPEFGPNVHGFDEFFGILSGNADMYSHKTILGDIDLFENTQPAEAPGYLTELLTDRAVRFIEKHARGPFFMYVAYNAVHWPFQVPGRPGDVRTRQSWYDGTRQDYVRMLESMDEGVGRILEALDRQRLANDTLVIFSDDNGGENRLTRNVPLFHNKGSLWEGGIRVPCLLRWPGRLRAGTVSDQVAITMDLTATILAATGTTAPQGRVLDGIDIMPILEGKKSTVERTLFWRIDRAERKQKAVRKGKWKYILDGGHDLLFDLEQDISERHNLRYQHLERVAEMKKMIEAWEAELAQAKPMFVVK